MSPRHLQFAHAKLSAVATLAITVFMLLCGLFWLLNPTPTTYAQSQPEALGSVSGVVRNAQGNALPNITVWLEHYTMQYENRKVTSNAQGLFEFFSVQSGIYRLRFEDEQKLYASIYYANAPLAQDAQTVAVNGDNVVGIDMQLQLGGAISVTLQNSPQYTTTSYSLKLYTRGQDGQWGQYRSASPQNGQSSILLDALPAGRYQLCVDGYDYNTGNRTVECFQNVLPRSYGQFPLNATEINVQAGAQAVVQMTLNDLTQLEGYVLDQNDQTLADVPIALIDVSNPNIGYPSQQINSDANGYYRFSFVPSSKYVIVFNYPDQSNTYAPSYYPSEIIDAPPVGVEIDASSRISLTQKLLPGGRILGKITLPNNVPLTRVSLTLYRQFPDATWRPMNNCYSFCAPYSYDVNTGVYTITQLTAGRYRLGAINYTDNYNSSIDGYYGGDSVESADDIVVGVGETKSNISFVLGVTDFDSSISGVVSATTGPLEGIEVGNFAPYYDSNFSAMPFAQTTTDGQGQYRLQGLGPGYYLIAFRDPTGIYATTFYTSSNPYGQREFINIGQMEARENINITLSPGGTIRGHIRTEPEVSPGGYIIQLLSIQSDINNPYPYPTEVYPYADIRSDANGFFEVSGLAPGAYSVRAYVQPTEYPYPPYFMYRYHPAQNDFYRSNVVKVEAGKIREGIDILYLTSPDSFLPAIKSAQPTPIFSLTPSPQFTPPPYIPTPTPTYYPIPTSTPAR